MLVKKPVWMPVVAANPPLKNIVYRPVEHTEPPTKPANNAIYDTRLGIHLLHKPRVWRPKKLHYVEDELRNLFYHQHPWELAQPKNLVENSGDDVGRADWSHLKQVHRPVDGESVVQRTVWLAANTPNTLITEAYDLARTEFYRVRMEEEADQHVSNEESVMYGAVFPKTLFELLFETELQRLARWKTRAIDRSNVNKARKTAHVMLWADEEADESAETA